MKYGGKSIVLHQAEDSLGMWLPELPGTGILQPGLSTPVTEPPIWACLLDRNTRLPDREQGKVGFHGTHAL